VRSLNTETRMEKYTQFEWEYFRNVSVFICLSLWL